MRAPRLARRSSHPRCSKSGRPVMVREHWVLGKPCVTERKSSSRHPCPKCGTQIISVRMPNGGWVHFERRFSLAKLKRPCMHIGETIGSCNCGLILDLSDRKHGYAEILRALSSPRSLATPFNGAFNSSYARRPPWFLEAGSSGLGACTQLREQWWSRRGRLGTDDARAGR